MPRAAGPAARTRPARSSSARACETVGLESPVRRASSARERAPARRSSSRRARWLSLRSRPGPPWDACSALRSASAMRRHLDASCVRKLSLLTVERAAGFVLGIDFGGTKVALGAATRDGDVLATRRLPTDAGRGAGQAVARALDAARELC